MALCSPHRGDDRERGVHKGEQIDYFSPLAGSKTAEPGTCGSTVPRIRGDGPDTRGMDRASCGCSRTRGDGPIGVCTKYCDSGPQTDAAYRRGHYRAEDPHQPPHRPRALIRDRHLYEVKPRPVTAPLLLSPRAGQVRDGP